MHPMFRFRVPFLIASLFAVGHYLRSALEILLSLDDRQGMSQTLVLDDGGMADPLVLIEDAVGKHSTLGTHLQPAIRKVIEVYIPATQFSGNIVLFQNDLLAVVRKSELIANVALFAVTQDVVEPICWNVKRTM